MAPRNSDLKHLSISAAAAARMRRIGCTPSSAPLWTAREIAICRTLYPDFAAMKRKLPRRTRQSIRIRCHLLGLSVKVTAWTGADILRLRRLFPAASWPEMLQAFPGRNRMSIKAKAYSLGMKRKRKPYKKIGLDVIDQVRARCFELNFFMSDLDEWTRQKDYFRNAILKRKLQNT